MLTMKDVLFNPHFRRLVAFLRIPLCFQDWRERYLREPVDLLAEKLFPAMPIYESVGQVPDPDSLIKCLRALVQMVVTADPRLILYEEDLRWFEDLFRQFPRAIPNLLSLLLAAVYTVPEMMTIGQLVEHLQEPEISWRRRAENGEIPGAAKASNRWLFPCSSLYVLGILKSSVFEPAHIILDMQVQQVG